MLQIVLKISDELGIFGITGTHGDKGIERKTSEEDGQNRSNQGDWFGIILFLFAKFTGIIDAFE